MATDGVAKEEALKATKLNEVSAKVAEGFMDGAGVGEFNVQTLLECIYVADGAAQELEGSIL